MNITRAGLRRAVPAPRCPVGLGQWTRKVSGRVPAPRRRFGRYIALATICGGATAAAYYYPQLKAQLSTVDGDASPRVRAPQAEIEFEKPRRETVSKDDQKKLLSSQNLQVRSSWEHPGVYVWGSNVGRVVDPDSSEKNIKHPRRFKFFNDRLLRDMKLSQSFGAAVTEQGDLVQWGLGFSKDDPSPLTTVKGKDLAKIEVSADRIIALSRNGSVYAIPASRDDLKTGLKDDRSPSSWLSLWKSDSGTPSPRNLTPAGLGWGEKVIDVSSGLEHCLLLTSKGRVFSAASSSSEFPSKGQMGIPGLTWNTRPKDCPYDQPHEITALKGTKGVKIATGDYHSVILDRAGSVFTFGDNLYGQLGFEVDIANPFTDTPTPLPTSPLYRRTELTPKVTSVAAGGNNTFIAVDAESTSKSDSGENVAPGKHRPQTTFDLWAAGQGVYGTLGTGRWTHVSTGPTKIKALSSQYEFDDSSNKLKPIRVKNLSVGTTHCAAVMDNATRTSASRHGSESDINWGSDVMLWGGNEHYQLGTRKRNNLNEPSHIEPMEGELEKGMKGTDQRFCVTPRQTVRLGKDGKGRKVTLEQKIECGRFATGVYSSV